MGTTDREVVRDLARKVAEIAHSEKQDYIRELWAKNNNLEVVERPPMVCRREPGIEERLVCQDPWLRGIEHNLHRHLYHHDELDDDWVIEPWYEVQAVHIGEDRRMMWGVNIDVKHPDGRGAWIFKPEIKTEADIQKLRVPRWEVDERATAQSVGRYGELLGDILPIRLTYGRLGYGAGLAYWGAYLRGLEQMMWDAYDRPEWLHRFFKFLGDAHMEHLRGLEADGHIVRNDNNMLGHCNGLPQPDFDGVHVRFVDCWGGGDSQEFALVSPDMHEEFLLNYQVPVLELFGLTSYGCCEPLTHKFGILKRNIGNLRRVAISPWTDLETAVEELGRDYVLQWRPNPSHVIFNFDEEQMRADVARTMEIAGDCFMDFSLQDVETVNGEPWRLPLWVRIAKEEGLRHREKSLLV